MLFLYKSNSMAKQELQVNFTGDTSKLKKATQTAEKTVKGFDDTISKLSKNIALAFGTREIIHFGVESVKLAAKIEGVQRAFSSLSGTSLPELQRATKGTVDNMRLMQAAVQARNFKIPLEQLAGFFEFATKRAAETGESVDYLVNSIVLGIGRKSPLILDNLGISAVELRKKLKGVGIESATTADIAESLNEIIKEQQEEFGGLGNEAVTTGQKLERLNSTWQNLKTSIGQAVIQTGLVDELTRSFDRLSDSFEVSKIEGRLGIGVKERRKIFQDILKEVGDVNTAEKKYAEEIKKRGATLDQSNKFIDDYLKNLDYELGIKKRVNKESETATSITEDQQKILDKVAEAQKLWNTELEIFGTRDYSGQISTLQAAIVSLVSSGLSPANAEISRLMSQLTQLQGMVSNVPKTTPNGAPNATATNGGIEAMNASLNERIKQQISGGAFDLGGVLTQLTAFEAALDDIGFSFENLGMQFSNTFSQMLVDGSLTFRSLAQEIGKMIIKLLTALALQATIRSLFGDATAGVRATSTVASTIAGVSGAIGAIPQLASGGIATSPTLAMIGEGRESEAVLPLSKLEYMMSNSGGMQDGQIVGMLRGSDILLQYQRAGKAQKRSGSINYGI